MAKRSRYRSPAGYDSRRVIVREFVGSTTPEEDEVYFAITKAGYQVRGFCGDRDEDPVHPRDWIPAYILYNIYKDYHRTRGTDDPRIVLLSRNQFGAAIKAAFDGNVKSKRRLFRLKNTLRKQIRGYSGIKGPRSERIQYTQGRPRQDGTSFEYDPDR